MPRLHDAKVRDEIKARVRAVKADAAPRFGSMTVDQMMWHVSTAIELALGRFEPREEKAPAPLPKPVLRFVVLNLPWPKGAPTASVMKVSARHDLEAERERCLALIDEFTARPIDGQWPIDGRLGSMSGVDYSRLEAKHLDHHLKQFGV